MASTQQSEKQAPIEVRTSSVRDSVNTDTAARDQATNSQADAEQCINRKQFQYLVGIIQTPPDDAIAPLRHKSYTYSNMHQLFNNSLPTTANDVGRHTSLYYTIVSDERQSRWIYRLCLNYIYFFYIAQLIIASSLVVLGAVQGNHHISVAVLGATTGTFTGLLSLIKSQGLPNRALHYADLLRQVREDIEFVDRKLGAKSNATVGMSVLDKLRDEYKAARDDKKNNHPDIWASKADSKAAVANGQPSAAVRSMFSEGPGLEANNPFSAV